MQCDTKAEGKYKYIYIYTKHTDTEGPQIDLKLYKKASQHGNKEPQRNKQDAAYSQIHSQNWHKRTQKKKLHVPHQWFCKSTAHLL